VRTFVADVLRRVEAQQMGPERARVLFYGAQILAGLVQGTDLEERIAALERTGARPVLTPQVRQ
jgi:hypothetical protein